MEGSFAAVLFGNTSPLLGLPVGFTDSPLEPALLSLAFLHFLACHRGIASGLLQSRNSSSAVTLCQFTIVLALS
jgi:hypothetical protein